MRRRPDPSILPPKTVVSLIIGELSPDFSRRRKNPGAAGDGMFHPQRRLGEGRALRLAELKKLIRNYLPLKGPKACGKR